jgi:hypothetical protein
MNADGGHECRNAGGESSHRNHGNHRKRYWGEKRRNAGEKINADCDDGDENMVEIRVERCVLGIFGGILFAK